MTNNFTPKKSGAAARPQLSPEEYAAKKKAEKDAVYQMIDDTATEIVSDPDKFRAYLDTQARMDRYSAANALLIYKQQPQATQLKDFRDWQEDGVKVNRVLRACPFLNLLNTPRMTALPVLPTMLRRCSMWHRPAARSLLHPPLTVTPENLWRLCLIRLPLM